MSWGIKIAVLYLSFVALIITMVTMSMKQQVDLVTPDYYEKELQYQDRINTIARTSRLPEQLQWKMNYQALVLKFPSHMKGKDITGSVYFFRPSDANMDQTCNIPADTSLARSIPLEKLAKGMYKMEISWKYNGEDFYNEGVIHL